MQLMKLEDAARLTGVSVPTIKALARKGTLKLLVMVDVSKLYQLKVKSILRDERARGKVRAAR